MKEVLYYDGKMYQGWQKEKGGNVNEKEREKLEKTIRVVTGGKLTEVEITYLMSLIKTTISKEIMEDRVKRSRAETSGGCQY